MTRGNAEVRTGRAGGGLTPASAWVESLEARALLSDSTIKIPVLNYHRVLPPQGDPRSAAVTAGDYQRNFNIDETAFEAHLAKLAELKFQSLTPRNYLAWRNGGPMRVGFDEHVLRAGEFPFMAVFDDANQTDLRAAELMKARNFTAVAAVPTRPNPAGPDCDDDPFTLDYYVGNVAAGCATWDQVKALAGSTYKWEIASHSLYHLRLGDGISSDVPSRGGKAKPLACFQNTPAELDAVMRLSRQDIIDNAFAGDASRAPVAFFHPYHDLTRRSLSVGSEYYPLMFGKAFAANDPANPPQFIGKTSDPHNGELVRIEISSTTSAQDLGQMLALASADAPFARPTFVQRDIPHGYVARDGTVVVDGLEGDDRITLDDQSVTLPLWDESVGSAASRTVDLAGFRRSHYATGVSPKAIDVHGGRGDDQITVANPFSAALAVTRLNGGPGDDGIAGGSGVDVVSGGAGNDSVSGGGGADRISGGDGDDLLGGNAQNDRIDGGAGDDRLNGHGGRDKLSGQEGDDRLFGGASGDWLSGQAGADELYGDGGHDRLSGGDGRDTLRGNAGNDLLVANDGAADELFGDGGVDTAVADEKDELVSLEL